MVLGVLGGLLKPLDDRRRCRKIRIADAQVDEINPLLQRLLFELIHRRKKIGGKTADSMGELGFRHKS